MAFTHEQKSKIVPLLTQGSLKESIENLGETIQAVENKLSSSIEEDNVGNQINIK